MLVPLAERVASWLRAADADRELAAFIRDKAPHLACFRAQQAAEKALEALLTAHSGDAPPVHAAMRLLAALDSLHVEVPADVRAEAASLDKFYVPTRYPDALGFVDAALAYRVQDADGALASADMVIARSRARARDLAGESDPA